MRILIKFILFIILYSEVVGQVTNYNKRHYEFVGYFNDRPIYQYFSSGQSEIKNYTLFYANLDKVKNVSFVKFKDFDKELLFYNDSIFIVESWIDNKTGYQIDLYINDIKVKSFLYKQRGYDRKNLKFVFSSKHNKLFFPYSDDIDASYTRLAYIDFSQNYELILLPILGQHPELDINQEYLYFSATHIVDCYSDFPDDVYKVQIGEWNNTQLVLEQASELGWSLLPNSKVIYSVIGVDGKSSKNAFYNTIKKSIKITENYSASSTIIKYKGQYYFEIDWKRNSPIFFRPVKIPTSFPIPDNRFVCPDDKRIYMNIPNHYCPIKIQNLSCSFLIDRYTTI
jgi:hypothetical protein